MRGEDQRSENIFSYVRMEQRIAADHPLRAIRDLTDAALRDLSRDFSKLYARDGRPSIPPERLSRALSLQAFFTVRSERQLMEPLVSSRFSKRAMLFVQPLGPEGFRANGLMAFPSTYGIRRETSRDRSRRADIDAFPNRIYCFAQRKFVAPGISSWRSGCTSTSKTAWNWRYRSARCNASLRTFRD
jgi:hypothetical protein